MWRPNAGPSSPPTSSRSASTPAPVRRRRSSAGRSAASPPTSPGAGRGCAAPQSARRGARSRSPCRRSRTSPRSRSSPGAGSSSGASRAVCSSATGTAQPTSPSSRSPASSWRSSGRGCSSVARRRAFAGFVLAVAAYLLIRFGTYALMETSVRLHRVLLDLHRADGAAEPARQPAPRCSSSSRWPRGGPHGRPPSRTRRRDERPAPRRPIAMGGLLVCAAAVALTAAGAFGISLFEPPGTDAAVAGVAVDLDARRRMRRPSMPCLRGRSTPDSCRTRIARSTWAASRSSPSAWPRRAWSTVPQRPGSTRTRSRAD